MGVVNTKVTAVTNADLVNPQTNNPTRLQNGRIKESVGTLEAANGDSIGSTYRFARIHSSWRPSQVLLSCDPITSGAMDVGLYDIASVNAGAVIDADFFASAVSIAAALVHSDITHEADAADVGAGYGLADVEKPLWQALGLTVDPGKWYDVVGTLTAATTAAGTVALHLRYIDGN